MIRVELDHATVVFTDRRGGSSAEPFDSLNLGLFTADHESAVQANLSQVEETLGLSELHVLKQIHSASIIDVNQQKAIEPPSADGMITAEPNHGLLVTGADCPPVAIAGPESVAMLHCGWRPLAAGIIESALERLGNGPLQAAVGPGVSRQNYEVGQEVVDELGVDGEAAYIDGHLSLHAVIEAKLRRGGVERIKRIDACTFAESDDYFSYRRDGSATGRQAGIAWRS